MAFGFEPEDYSIELILNDSVRYNRLSKNARMKVETQYEISFS